MMVSSNRNFPQDSRRRRIVIVALALVLVVVLLLLWLLAGRGVDRASQLLQLLEEARAELEHPGRTVAEAAGTLGSAEAAHDFVMQDIALVPYIGRRQTPDQVLTTRMANPVDRAALFGALLQDMGWKIVYLQLYPLADTPLALGRPPDRDGPALTALRAFLDRQAPLPPEQQDKAEAAARSGAAAAMRDGIAATVERALELLETAEGSPGLNYPWSSDNNTIGSYLSWNRYVVLAERDGERRLFELLHAGYDPMQEEPLARLMDVPLDGIPYDTSYYEYEMPDVAPVILRLGVVDSTGLDQTLIEWRGNPAAEELELRFLPATDPLGRLRDGTRPEQVDMWQPHLRVNGRLISGTPFSLRFGGAGVSVGRRPPVETPEAFAPADPATATALEIARIDAADWPLVRVGLSIKAGGGGLWLPDHFLLRDQGRARPLRLLSVEQSARPLLILTDVSWSMGDTDAFEASKRAILSLIEVIPEGQPVGLTAFAGGTSELVPLAPLTDRTAFAAAVAAMEMASYTGILNALDQAAGSEALAGGVLLLLSDGEDNVGGDEEAIIARLKQAGIKVYAIPLGEAADAALLERVAGRTGGQLAFQDDAKGLAALFRRIGAEVSSQVQLQYRVQPEAEPKPEGAAKEGAAKAGGPAGPDNPSGAAEAGETATAGQPVATAGEGAARPGAERRITVALRDTALAAEGRYTPPARAGAAVPHLYLSLRAAGIDSPEGRARRVLLRLDRPDTALRLTGTWSLIGALGAYPERAYLIRYFSRWIDALRLQGVRTPAEIAASPEAPPPRPMDEWLADPARRWPSLGRMRLVNAYRNLAALDTERGPVSPAPGPVMYMLHSEFAENPASGGQVLRRRLFDVLLRPARPLNSGEWNRDTLAGEIAASVAEGRLLGGEDAITGLLDAGTAPVFTPLAEAGDGDGFPPGLLSAIGPGWEGSTLIRAPGARQWLWQIDTEFDNNARNRFRAFRLGRDSYAKGASLEQIAHEFEKIDKLLGLYASAYGNFAGLTPFASAELAAIASFKQAENKLWCYATLMMSQIGEAIESEDALLNRDVNAARAKAARLCRIEGGPDGAENGDLLRDAARNAVKEWARNYGINKTKEAVGDPISTGWSAWETGGALWDAVRSFRGEGYAAGPSGSGAGGGGGGFPLGPAQELAIAQIVAAVP